MESESPDPRVPVDPNALEGLRRFGGDALLRQVVTLFRDQVRVRHEAMRGAVANGDPATARNAAHALKSSAGQVGAVGMQELCQRIERAAADGDRARVAEFVAEFDYVIPATDTWLSDRGFPREP